VPWTAYSLSWTIVIDPRRPDTIVVGSGCLDPTFAHGPGIVKSLDGGATWSVSADGLGATGACVDGLVADPVDPDRLYASTSFASYRSEDGGHSWIQAGPVPGVAPVTDPSGPAKRYGLIQSGAFLRSADEGRTWSAIHSEGIVSGSVFRYNALTIDSQTERLFLAASTGVYRSRDGGQSWIRLAGAARDRINGVIFDPATGGLTIATQTGLFRSPAFPWNDWSPANIELSTTSIRILAVDPKHSGTLYATDGDDVSRLFVTNDAGASWRMVAPLPVADGQSEAQIIDLTVAADGAIYAATFIGGGTGNLYKLAPAALEWTAIRLPFGGVIQFVVADPRTPGEYYVAGVGLAHTRDDGATWELTGFSALEGSPRSLAIDPSDSDVVHLSTSQAVLKSSDRGRTWGVKATLLITTSAIVVSRADPSILYVGSRPDTRNPLIARSLDGGESWTTVEPPEATPFADVRQLVPDRRDRLTVYAVSSKGALFRSTDAGLTWEPFADQPGGSPVAALAIDSGGSLLHAGTAGRGVWELPLDSRHRAAHK
jgi:photosystem II stability/assembly factor-like uncharacterized protein